jgi:RNA polymerase sigma factor (sigma-70 family)
LLKIAVALLHDTNVAEDVVHDVFLCFLQSVEALKLDGSLKAYLRICVVNSVRNKIRDEKVRSHTKLNQNWSSASNLSGSDQWIILKEESTSINNALIQVPFEQREVVVLHLYGDMKFREIAKLQDASLKTIQNRYRYGLDKLKSILDSEVEK